MTVLYLSWIIPTYNEEERIAKTVREVDGYLKSKNFADRYEIIVVDSASGDRTAERVKTLAAVTPALGLVSVQNRGKGWAVKQGMLSASGDIRIFSDADNSVSPDQCDRFLPIVCGGGDRQECFDVVIGSIEAEGAAIEEHAQWYRRSLGKLSKYVIRVGADLWEIRDTQRGFKMFSRRAAERIFPQQTITGWGFDIEILLIAKRNGLRIHEVPVRWVNPGDSKVSIGAYASTFKELVEIKRNDLQGLYGTSGRS